MSLILPYKIKILKLHAQGNIIGIKISNGN